MGLLLAGLDWRSGDRVLTLEHEFPNNLYAPGALGRFGVEMAAVPWERLYESVDARTRLVVLSSVNYTTGFAPPLAELADFLRSRGILLFVDGTQSVGALQFDVGRVRPDMLAVHGYKWMFSPDGAGFFYIAPELRERLQPSTVSAGAAIGTGETSTTCITASPNFRQPRKNMKAAGCRLRCSTGWRHPSI